MNRRLPIVVGGLAVAAFGWFLFRPELLFINKSVNESFPGAATAQVVSHTAAAAPTTLASGSFHGVAHETRGTASVHALPDGKRVIRFTNFETSNGPDVRVLLIAASDASDNDTVKNSSPVELGTLKGNVGDQNYDIPADLDLNKYKAVCIWCNRFSVNFGAAPLAMK